MSGTGGLNRSASRLAAWRRRLLGAERTIAVRYSGARARRQRALPAFQVVAPTSLPGIGFDRSKVPAMVQTLPGDVSSHKIKAGLAAGVGIEGRLVGNWTAKVEYLCLDLGKHHPDLGVEFNDRGRVQFPITDNSVCVGVNYKFDP
jgi:opacity protein-like surface antigen